MGTKVTLSDLYPTFLMKSETSFLTSLYLRSEQLTVYSSILLQPTIICLIPKVNARTVCSLVCPSFEKPASNSPDGRAIMRSAQSAYEVPFIIFLIKSLWPGASISVKWYLLVSNCYSDILIVIPRSLSDLSLFMTHAYLYALFPWDAVSLSSRQIVF